jgi:hypothetical protein
MSTQRFDSPNGHAATATASPPPPGSEPAFPPRAAGGAPSANGHVGDATPAEKVIPAARDANGRFAKGNPGGPGNPFGRLVAKLRLALLESVTPEDIQAIAQTLTQLAKEGDVQAAKLVLAYTIGKPVAAADPDRVDEEEWDRFKAQAAMMENLPDLIKKPAPDLPLDILRTARPVVGRYQGAILGNLLAMPAGKAADFLDRLATLPPQKAAAVWSKLATPGRKPPSPNGKNGAP